MVEQQEPGSTDSEFSARLIAADDTRYELSAEQTLGRSQDADITISDAKISRKHALFRVTGQQLTVEDLGSANGTRVNQRRIEGTTVLCDGDVVSFDTVELNVALSGAVDDNDATVVACGEDATIVGSYTDPVPDPDAAPDPEPAPAATPPDNASPADLPGSWVEEPAGEFTRVLSMEDAAAEASAVSNVASASDLPHLIITTESGTRAILELDPAGGEKEDVWEIGRDESCQIVVPDDSVSSTHAQLIHQNGRWRLVNLVSTNGIYVNGKKRLTAYLADGDQIKLGTATLIFKAGSAAPASSPSRASGQGTGNSSGELASRLPLLGFAAVVVALGLWWLLR